MSGETVEAVVALYEEAVAIHADLSAKEGGVLDTYWVQIETLSDWHVEKVCDAGAKLIATVRFCGLRWTHASAKR